MLELSLKVSRVYVSRELESEMGVGLKPRHFDLGSRHPKWHLNCYAEHLSLE